MRRDVEAVHGLLAELLTDARARHRWQADPTAFASARLEGAAEVEMIATLSSDGISAAALHLDMKRILAARGAAELREPRGVRDHSVDPRAMKRPVAYAPPNRPLLGLAYWPDLSTQMTGEENIEVWEFGVDDFLDSDGPRRFAALLDGFPVTLHSVNLSLGSSEVTSDPEILRHLGSLIEIAEADCVSDHLAFTRIRDRSLGHFEPLWRVPEAADLVSENIARLQDRLKIQVAIENIAPLFDPGGEMSEAEFINQVVERAGCSVLLDVSNMNLNERNGFCSAARELSLLRTDRIAGIHLAGGQEENGLHYDAHSFPVDQADLDCLGHLMPVLTACKSVIVERDGRRAMREEISNDLRSVQAVLRGAAGPHDAVSHMVE